MVSLFALQCFAKAPLIIPIGAFRVEVASLTLV